MHINRLYKYGGLDKRLTMCIRVCILIRMPNRTIYIKEQHIDFWDRLRNKSSFVEDAIDRLAIKKIDGEKIATFDKKPEPIYKKTSNWGA